MPNAKSIVTTAGIALIVVLAYEAQKNGKSPLKVTR